MDVLMEIGGETGAALHDRQHVRDGGSRGRRARGAARPAVYRRAAAALGRHDRGAAADALADAGRADRRASSPRAGRSRRSSRPAPRRCGGRASSAARNEAQSGESFRRRGFDMDGTGGGAVQLEQRASGRPAGADCGGRRTGTRRREGSGMFAEKRPCGPLRERFAADGSSGRRKRGWQDAGPAVAHDAARDRAGRSRRFAARERRRMASRGWTSSPGWRGATRPIAWHAPRRYPRRPDGVALATARR